MSVSPNGLYCFDEFKLDGLKRTLTRAGEPVGLSPKAFEILAYLVTHSGQVATKEELLKAVWPDSFVEEGNLSQHVSGLRKAFGERAGYIVTIPGRGYQFTGQVQCEIPAQGGFVVQTVRERTQVVVHEGLPEPQRLALAGSTRTRVWPVVAAAVVAAASVAGFVVWRHSRVTPSAVSVVLADVVNETGDSTFDLTLKRALQINLEQSPYMDVMSDREAANTLQLMGRSRNATVPYDTAREICERSNRQVVLKGTISLVGSRYLLTLDGTDCSSGKTVAAAKAEARSKDDVLQALDNITERVRRGLNESSKSLARYGVPLHTATTSSLEALEEFSLGKYLQEQGRRREATPAFQRAIALDPQFAMAYRELGVNDSYIGQDEQASQEYAEAFRLSDHVSAMEQLKIRATYYAMSEHDMLEGIKAFELWATTYPQDPVPVSNVADAYMRLGQYQVAAETAERCSREFPDFATSYENLSTIYQALGRFDDAKAATNRAAQVGTGDTGLHLSLFNIAMAQRDYAALARETAWFDAHEDGATVWYYPGFRGGAAAAMGEYADAEELFRRAYDSAQRANLPEAANSILIEEARAELGLGHAAEARATLQRIGEWKSDLPDLAELHVALHNSGFAESYLAAHQGTSKDTLLTNVFLPRVRASVALERGKPEEAIQALEPARPFEMRDYIVPSLRGAAYLKNGQPELAAAEYKKIVEHPGIAPDSVLYPLAYLGLARADAAMKRAADSRQAYETLFALWKDADAGDRKSVV